MHETHLFFVLQDPFSPRKTRKPYSTTAELTVYHQFRLTPSATFRYPFLLPNLFGASCALLVLVLIVLYVPETVDFENGSSPRSNGGRCDECSRLVSSEVVFFCFSKPAWMVVLSCLRYCGQRSPSTKSSFFCLDIVSLLAGLARTCGTAVMDRSHRH